MAKLSIIMPVYNVENHIYLFKKAISGIINQSYKDYELLIGCDGYGGKQKIM